MKLYYTKGACSLACRILINELKLPCDYIVVDLKSKKTEHGENFFEINPKGSVPVLITDDNETITENAVIQQYIADQYHATQLLPEMGNIMRYKVLEGVNFVTTEMHKGFSVLFNPMIPEEVKKSVFAPAINNKFNYINDILAKREYLVSNDFTLPDGYLFVILTWAIHFKFNLADWPHIENYFNKLTQRDSIKLSLEQEKII